MHRVPPFTLRVGVVGADRVGCLHDDFDASDNGYLASSTVARTYTYVRHTIKSRWPEAAHPSVQGEVLPSTMALSLMARISIVRP